MNKEEKKRLGIPLLCPQCRSSRLSQFTHEKKEIILNGFSCLKCGYKNARRLMKK